MSTCCKFMDCCKPVQSNGWLYPTLLLCAYGFFTMMRPSEPFLTPYLVGPDKNLTIDQVTNEILPVWTYSYLVILVPIFLVTDYLRYKPVLMLQGISFIATWLMLLFAHGVLAMQFLEFTYGFVSATEIAYYSYIYSIVDLKHYQKVTSYCRSITLVAYTFGSVLGQVLVSVGDVSYFILNVISLVSVSLGFLVSIPLPMPKRSMFFHRKETEGVRVAPSTENVKPAPGDAFPQGDLDIVAASQGPADVQKGAPSPEKAAERKGIIQSLFQLYSDFKESYSSPEIIYWSAWWALATCGYLQVTNYIQVLWDHIEPSRNDSTYNGGVEAVSTFMRSFQIYEKCSMISRIWPQTFIVRGQRCCYVLRRGLCEGGLARLGRIRTRHLFSDRCQCFICHGLCRQHLGLLRWLCRVQSFLLLVSYHSY
ncbi:thiamine transporter 2-like isoform X5 [Mobula birostris]